MVSEIIKICLFGILAIIDKLFPKTEQFCFYITPRTFWDSNQQALLQYIKFNTNEKYIIVDANVLSFTSPIKSLMVFIKLMSSKYIIFDHSLPPGIKSQRHIRVNLWHGTPLKSIRFHLSDEKSKTYSLRQAPITDLLASNSNYDALLMSSAMNIPRFNVMDRGLPRNDYLLADTELLQKLDLFNDQEKLDRLEGEFSKKILWAPTFRGTPRDLKDPLYLSDEQQMQLIKVLETNNIALWIRAHKFSKVTNLSLLMSHKNVFDVSSIENTNIVLRNVDLLITDFSSIWIDYLLLKRPIIIYAEDIDAYENQQGFILDFKSQLPSPFVDNFDRLIKQIEENLKLDDFDGYRDSIKKFHDGVYKANKSELVYQQIKNYKRPSIYSSQAQ